MSSPDIASVTGRPKLIFGCGYLGSRVAARWLSPRATDTSSQPLVDGGPPNATSQHTRVVALTRSNGETLRALGIEPIPGDVLDPESLQNLPAASTVLYAVGLDRSAGKSMREVYVSGLEHVLNTLPECEKFIYISSTSVYAQSNGELVYESSLTEPREESGKVALEAEQLLRLRQPNAIVLRFAGIYGPDRLLRKQALLAGEPLVGDADKWLNLIHVDDGVEAILTTESHGEPGKTYNIADDEPVTRRDFYAKLAELLKASPPKFDHRPEPDTANRRISNALAKWTLGWQPRFATYRTGLVAAVSESAE
jgi:nucleoside-diphosphate-sugar epimerase